jgi:6-pyruvoyltetrahydropterin/6-carboxytetrahydropterin synthase
MLTCGKIYKDFPAAHRQPNHDGHCRFLHGHNYDFEFTFAAHHRDENGFIVDFGKLSFIKEYLTSQFDHTCCISADDILLERFKAWRDEGLIQLRVMPDTSAEGMALAVYEHVDSLVRNETKGRVWIQSVRVWEDSKNFATFSAK